MDFTDPARIDRQIEETAQALVRWRQRLRDAPASAAESDPFVGRRGVSTRAALQAIQRMPDALPGKDALLRWVAFLTIERVTVEDLVEFEGTRRAPAHVVPALGRQPKSLRELGLEAVFHRDPERRAIAADAMTWRADDASSNALWWLARRHEAAVQLGIGALSTLEEPFAEQLTAQTAAAIVLDATEDLARDVLSKGKSWQDALALGTAADAQEGWPARLTSRWLLDLFGGTPMLAGLKLAPGPMPAALNGASFLRAMARFGAALHRGAGRAISPMFAVAQQPFDAGPAAYGALFASLLATPAFLRRRLGLGATTAVPQQRAMARALLIGLRVCAAKAVVASMISEAAAREAHASWVSRALCSSSPGDLAGVMPRYDARSAALLAGALLGATRRAELVSSYDEDWFDNPRGQACLREVDVTTRQVVSEEGVRQGVRSALELFGEAFC